MRALLDGGLTDAGHATKVRDAAAATRASGGGSEGHAGVPVAVQQSHSVPTLINEDAMHAAEMRLDYALANAELTQRCTLSSSIARDAETEKLSDHYPLLTDLDCEAW